MKMKKLGIFTLEVLQISSLETTSKSLSHGELQEGLTLLRPEAIRPNEI